MASTTGAAPIEKWGVESEKNIGVDDAQAYKDKVWVDTIPWDYNLFRELLEKYSKVAPDQVEAEIFKIRDKAWAIAKYPCIGYFTFLRLLEFGGENPVMVKAIERLKAPGSQETFLELGGFICQTIRQLAYEGVDSARLYGSDLHPEFLELGYEMFHDRDTLKATLVAGDLLVPDEEYASSAMAKTFNGKINIAHASNFFHLFGWDAQLVICERIVRFFRRGLSRETPAVLFGSHLGSVQPGPMKAGGFSVYAHDEKTFQSLWDEVGKKTGTSWKVSMEVLSVASPKVNPFSDNARRMRYIVTGEL
ncbi:hypothetical protein F5B22DRAFT_571176 [Xylaria bambusicola]|uniref:uncharacterized protein n=1 Tax=Xylaria bambusicola TaxID=326684 RepID=UPI002008D2EF|nr:uncharacterized protein F5B22DRAFT_571176 [Xylaria bambusicola]KAI0521375.1 hypothetical protein F5B22DRAFT_571176 [Xylaria bambusicola]